MLMKERNFSRRTDVGAGSDCSRFRRIVFPIRAKHLHPLGLVRRFAHLTRRVFCFFSALLASLKLVKGMDNAVTE